jgi:glycosyltransferase involved in cell wall biosynthesis
VSRNLLGRQCPEEAASSRKCPPADVAEARFSIIVTSHNQSQFIQAAVDSALSQNPILLREIIVVDDGSTDGSPELLEQYGDSIDFHPLARNIGAVEARNEGAARARGEYLVFLDGDDLLTPWALDVYERLASERKPAVVSGEVWTFSGPVPRIGKKDVPRQVRFAGYSAFILKDRAAGLQASAYVVDRKIFWQAGGWTPGLFQLDLQDLSVKLGFYPVALIVSPPTAFYRIHTNNSILSVPPFLRNLHRILDKERAGQYPGGRKHRFVRYAWLGGLTFFWIKRAIRARLYKGAIGIVISGWPMILAAIVRRAAAWIRGRQPIEAVDLHLEQ